MLKKRFTALLSPPLPSDWEAEENLEQLAELPGPRQDLILQQVPAIWPVSNSLCYSYLARADAALSCLAEEQVPAWVAALLDTYERAGLKAAQDFMGDVENNYLCRLRGETGLAFAEATPRLSAYAKGIAERPLNLEKGPELYTDTARIFLPGKVTAFPDNCQNFLLYKLMVTAQLGLIKDRTCEMVIPGDASFVRRLCDRYKAGTRSGDIVLEEYWRIFPEPRLAEDLFTLAEAWRLSAHIAAFFAGLWRDTVALRRDLAERRRLHLDSLPDKSRLVEVLGLALMTSPADRQPTTGNPREQSLIDRLNDPAAAPIDSAGKAAALYALLENIVTPYVPVMPLAYLGRLQPAAARQVRIQERAETRQKFITTLATILPAITPPPPGEGAEDDAAEESVARLTGEDPTAMIIKPGGQDQPDPTPPASQSETRKLLIIDNPELAIPETLKGLIAEINRDLGLIPDEYIAAAHGLAGKGNPPPNSESSPEGATLTGAFVYDEWDYRRGGFRKDWCSLNEKAVQPVKGTFVAKTLAKYRGLLLKLNKQFEMLRCTERLVRRQRDGDDLDLDAVIESLSDIRAGRPGSEKLFMRLRRDERDIAVLFLIDMSSSTEGWVGEALKEALILMGESLESLGDRYAIAGFSGMRRTRSDFYHIKDFTEAYGEEIKERIAAIAPQEYTRMGPPVRHATRMLQGVEAKIRLLIVLTDGKPEDYDDYKGEYAIEDTRHALIEAKAVGIHPFCINIDQQAHDYNARMYGEVNYVFIDKVSDLPIRMPAIYRNLTT